MSRVSVATEQAGSAVQADEQVTILRHHLNAMPPCVLTSLDVFAHRAEIRWRTLPPAADAIRIDLTAGPLPITAANLATAIGQRRVRQAIASLIQFARGEPDDHCHLHCTTVSHVVTKQANGYPLDRPDLRRPEEGGPS